MQAAVCCWLLEVACICIAYGLASEGEGEGEGEGPAFPPVSSGRLS